MRLEPFAPLVVAIGSEVGGALGKKGSTTGDLGARLSEEP